MLVDPLLTLHHHLLLRLRLRFPPQRMCNLLLDLALLLLAHPGIWSAGGQQPLAGAASGVLLSDAVGQLGHLEGLAGRLAGFGALRNGAVAAHGVGFLTLGMMGGL